MAVIFNITYEAWSDGQAPGIGLMGNLLKAGCVDTNGHSWGSFGLTVGIHRLAAIADRHGLKTSVMVNGVICEGGPQAVKEPGRARARDHPPLVGHGRDPVYLDESVPLSIDVTAHCHVMVRPSAAWVFEDILEQVLGAPDAWVFTREQMMRYASTGHEALSETAKASSKDLHADPL